MPTVRQYPLRFGTFTIKVPRGTRVVGILGPSLVVEEPEELVTRAMHLTGEVLPTDGITPIGGRYLGSFQEGLFAWHVYLVE